MCWLLGPNFLNAIVGNKNNCSSYIQFPTILHSYDDFCAIYNGATQQGKDYVSDAAARINLNLSGIIKFPIVLGRCCRFCISGNFIQSIFDQLISVSNFPFVDR